MGNPLIRKYDRKVNGPLLKKSAGILEDYDVKVNVATKEGSITRTPINDIDIVNKLYADGLVAGATGSWTAGSGETITVVNGLVTSISSVTFLILLETGDSILMENGDRMENN